MSKEIIAIRKLEIKKCKFCHRNNLVLLEDVVIYNIPVSTMVSFGEKIIYILMVTKMMVIKWNHCA